MCICAKSLQSCPTLCNPIDYVAHQVPLSLGSSRQESWSSLPRPAPGDLPSPGREPASLVSPALAGGIFTSATWQALISAGCHPRKAHTVCLKRQQFIFFHSSRGLKSRIGSCQGWFGSDFSHWLVHSRLLLLLLFSC